MLKYAAPLARRLRHLERPHMFRQPGEDGDALTPGQRVAEVAAAGIGSWTFLIIQSLFLAAWVVVNGLRLVGVDPPPFILLNLLLSFQAAFTGPVLLIAANVGALHDHWQSDRIERLGQQNGRLTEQNEQLVERIASLEEQVLERLDRLVLPPPPEPPAVAAPGPVTRKRGAHPARPARSRQAA